MYYAKKDDKVEFVNTYDLTLEDVAAIEEKLGINMKEKLSKPAQWLYIREQVSDYLVTRSYDENMTEEESEKFLEQTNALTDALYNEAMVIGALADDFESIQEFIIKYITEGPEEIQYIF